MALLVEGYEIQEELDDNNMCRGRSIADGSEVIIRKAKDENEAAHFYHNYFYTLQCARACPEYVASSIKLKKGPILILADLMPPLSQCVNVNQGWRKLPDGISRFLHLCVNFSRGLSQIHSQIQLHANLTPASILYSMETQEMKFSSFEFAVSTTMDVRESFGRIVTSAHTEEDLSFLRSFDAPELRNVQDPVDFRADFYSFGMVLFYVWTGHVGLHSSGIAFTPAKIAGELSDLPSPVAQIISLLLDRNPSSRYQSEECLLSDFKTCLEEYRDGITRSVPFVPTHRFRGRNIHFSSRIFGRNAELDTLSDIFRSCREEDGSVCLLISGETGSGKTCLMSYLMELATESGACVSYGKVDQPTASSTTYSHTTLNKLFTGLLETVKARDKSWRARLEALIKEHGRGVLDHAVPGIAAVPDIDMSTVNQEDLSRDLNLNLGKEEKSPPHNNSRSPSIDLDKDPNFLRNQILEARIGFLKMAASTSASAVFIIDDIHWADEQTLELMAKLSKARIPRLFVMGAFRPEEAPIAEMGLFQELTVHSTVMSLKAIEVEAIQTWVSDLFDIPVNASISHPLALILHDQSHGNPMFVRMLLEYVLQRGIVTYSDETGWTWDLTALSSVIVSDEAVLRSRISSIGELNHATLRFCQIVACIGSHVTIYDALDLLKYAFGHRRIPYISSEVDSILGVFRTEAISMNSKSNISTAKSGIKVAPDWILDLLSPAFAAHILDQKTDGIQFTHDRVRQAVLESIPSDLVGKLRLTIGCMLLDSPRHLQTAATQFNSVPGEVANFKQDALLSEVIRLNDVAAAQALRHFNFESYRRFSYWATLFAEKFENAWKDHHNLTFDALFHYCEALSLCGEDATKLYPTLTQHAVTLEQKIAVKNIEIHRSQLDGRIDKMAILAREALAILGLANYPATNEALEADVAKMVEEIDFDALDDASKWPLCDDKHHHLATLWSSYMVLGSKFSDSKVVMKHEWIWWCLTGIRILIEKRVYVEPMSTLLSWVAAACPYLAKYDLVKKIAHHSERILPQNPLQSSPWIALVNNIFNVGTYYEPYSSLVSQMKVVYNGLMTVVDANQLVYRAYSSVILIRLIVYEGRQPLPKVLETAVKLYDTMLNYAEGYANDVYTPTVLHFLRHLIGQTVGPATLSTAGLQEENFKIEAYLFDFVFVKLYTLFWAGVLVDIQHGLKWVDKMDSLNIEVTDDMTHMHMAFYAALILLRAASECVDSVSDGAPNDTFMSFMTRAEKIVADMRQGSLFGHANYLHKYLLLLGEIAHLKGDLNQARELFQMAISSCERNNVPHMRGLACEMMGRMLYRNFERNATDYSDEHIASSLLDGNVGSRYSLFDHSSGTIYLRMAHRMYIAWGCVVRVQAFEKEYADWEASPRISDNLTIDVGQSPEIIPGSIQVDESAVKSMYLREDFNSNSSPERAASNIFMIPEVKRILDNGPLGLLCADYSELLLLLEEIVHNEVPLSLQGQDWRSWLANAWDSVIPRLFAKEKRVYTNKMGKLYVRENAVSAIQPTVVYEIFKKQVVDLVYQIWLGTKNFTYTEVPLSGSDGKEYRLNIYWYLIDGHEEKRDLYFTFIVDITSKVLKIEKEHLRQHQIHARELELITSEKMQSLREAQAVQKERNEEMGRLEKTQLQFIDTLCHEIRNPLNGVLAGIEICRSVESAAQLEEGDEISSALNDVNSCATHLRVIIDDVLDYSKLKTGAVMVQYSPYMPFEAATTVYSMFRAAASRKKLDFELEASDVCKNITILGDANGLVQVIANLISNAVKFTPTGGKIILRMQAPKEGLLDITVTDTGIGIPKDRLKSLFTPFQFSRPSIGSSFGGSGLGLSISHQLVQKMGGALKVESTEGEGSTISVLLPFERLEGVSAKRGDININSVTMIARLSLTSSPELLELDPPAPSPTPPKLALTRIDEIHPKGLFEKTDKLTEPRVLATDDSAINCRVLRGLLKLIGIHRHVQFAGNGQEAVDKFIAANGQFDALLMDIEMPILDGFGACRLIREWEKEHLPEKKAVPIVALTGFVSESHRELATEVGMTAYLSKPIDKKRLKEIFKELCGYAI